MIYAQELIKQIDKKAGAVRACYITVAPGQEATYILKGQFARQFIDAGYSGSVPLLIQSEMAATGETAQQAADRIHYEEQLWVGLASMIETVRRTAKENILNAPDDLTRMAAHETAINQLIAMMP